jgi:hypothetical protein
LIVIDAIVAIFSVDPMDTIVVVVHFDCAYFDQAQYGPM